MKIDAGGYCASVDQAGEAASAAEGAGYDGWWATEGTDRSRLGWDRMPELIDDEVLHTFAIIGTPEVAVAEIQRRYGDLVTRITLAVPEGRDVARWKALFESLRAPVAR